MKVYNQETREFEEKEYVEKNDSGWLTLKTGITYRIKDGYVIIVFNSDFVFTATNVWTIIATLPVDARPFGYVYFNLFTNALDTRAVGASVKTDGTINILSSVGSEVRALGSFTYPI